MVPTFVIYMPFGIPLSPRMTQVAEGEPTMCASGLSALVAAG